MKESHIVQILPSRAIPLPEQLNLPERSKGNELAHRRNLSKRVDQREGLGRSHFKADNLPFVSCPCSSMEAIDAIPENMARRLESCLSIDENANKLTIAVSDPFNILALMRSE